MLKHVPSFMDAELLWVLAAMGHGDELVVVDRNFPAQSVAMETQSGKLITLGGMDAPTSIGGILELMPLDSFVDAPLAWMDPVDQPADPGFSTCGKPCFLGECEQRAFGVVVHDGVGCVFIGAVELAPGVKTGLGERLP